MKAMPIASAVQISSDSYVKKGCSVRRGWKRVWLKFFLLLSLLVLLISALSWHEVYEQKMAKMQQTIDQYEAELGNLADSVSQRTPPSGPGGECVSFVLADVRPNGQLGELTMPWIENAAALYPSVRVELWLAGSAVNNADFVRFERDNPGHIRVRVIPPLLVGQPLTGIEGGHIGKAYAMQQSECAVAIFFDADSWLCPGRRAVKAVMEMTNPDGSAPDVVWTMAQNSYGATKGKRDVFVSPEINRGSFAQEYAVDKRWGERNTGTVFLVRKSNRTRAWLNDTMKIYFKHKKQSLIRVRKVRDQSAFRESTYLHSYVLGSITEIAVSERRTRGTLVATSRFCRFSVKKGMTNKPPGCHCACDCTECMFVHSPTSTKVCLNSLNASLYPMYAVSGYRGSRIG